MATLLATVQTLSGQAWARDENGNMRELNVGDSVFVGESVITAEGANMGLQFADNEVMQIAGNETLLMTDNLASNAEASEDENMMDADVDAILAALEGEGDLLDELEAPAAGNTGSNGSSSIVQLMRIAEQTDGFEFGRVSALVEGDGQGDVVDPFIAQNQNNAPQEPVDTTAPDALTNLIISGDGTTVSGTGEPGATVEITDPTGEVIGSGVVGEDGTFEVVLTDPQTNGEELTGTQTDAAGNESPEATVTAPDTTAPDAPTLDINEDGTIVSGTGEPGATVEITDPTGEVIGSGVVGEDGTFEVVLTDPQTNGEELTGTQTDAAGNESPEATVTAPDTTAPDAPTITLDTDSGSVTGITNDGSYTVSNVEAGSTVEYSTDGGNTWTTDAPTAAEGYNSIAVRQTDGAGNVSGSTSISFTLDTEVTQATINITDVSGGDNVINSQELADIDQVSGTISTLKADESAVVNVTFTNAKGQSITAEAVVDGDSWSIATTPALKALAADGAYTVKADVVITDAAGNSTTATVTEAFAVDTTVTQATINITDVSGGDNVINSQELADIDQVSGTISTLKADESAVVNVTFTNAKGQSITAEAVVDGDSWSIATTPALKALAADGAYTVKADVVITDAAGNSTTATVTEAFAVDTTAPAAPVIVLVIDSGSSSIDGITNTGNFNVTGIEAGATLEYSTDGTNWTVEAPTATEGANSITVRQTDAAGNTSEPATLEFTLDTAAPDKPVITNIVDNAGDYSNVSLHGTGEPGATITLYTREGTTTNGIDTGGWSYSPAVTGVQVDAEGNWTVDISNLENTNVNDNEVFYATQSDTAGNQSAASNSVHYYHGDWASVLTEAGDDYVMLGQGNDTIKINANDSNDLLVIDGGQGHDKVVYDKDSSELSISVNAAGEIVVVQSGDTNILRNVEEVKVNNGTFKFSDGNELVFEPIIDVMVTATATAETINAGTGVDDLNGVKITAIGNDGKEAKLSVITGTNHDGFGVETIIKGKSVEKSNGDTKEIGVGEKIVVEFDNDISSMDVAFAWRHNGEVAEVTFYNDGDKVGSAKVSGVGNSTTEALVTYYDVNGGKIKEVKAQGSTDKVDEAFTFELPDALGNIIAFDKVEFSAPAKEDDYLIHEISYKQAIDSGTLVVNEDGEVTFAIQVDSNYVPNGDATATVRINGGTEVEVPLNATGNGSFTVKAADLGDLSKVNIQVVAVTGHAVHSATADFNFTGEFAGTTPLSSDDAISTKVGTPYTLEKSDFGDDLSHNARVIKITAQPENGGIYHVVEQGITVIDKEGNIATESTKVEVNAGDIISLSDIELGLFVFEPNSTSNGEFEFSVGDGTGIFSDVYTTNIYIEAPAIETTTADDQFFGTSGADTFAWSLDTAGGIDTVTDFNLADKDVLDLADILTDDVNKESDLSSYLSFSKEGDNTVLEIHSAGKSSGGESSSVTQKVVLMDVDFSSLGNTEDEIIKSLIDSGNLKID